MSTTATVTFSLRVSFACEQSWGPESSFGQARRQATQEAKTELQKWIREQDVGQFKVGTLDVERVDFHDFEDK